MIKYCGFGFRRRNQSAGADRRAEGRGVPQWGDRAGDGASNEKAYALERAKNAGIESVVVSRKSFVDPADYDRAVVETMQSRGIELVVLAGFLSILGKPVIEAYPERILNIHPSLIPSFCGAGFYGLRVHQAALDYGVKVTGATVHLVNEIPDGGRDPAAKGCGGAARRYAGGFAAPGYGAGGVEAATAGGSNAVRAAGRGNRKLTNTICTL